MRGHSPQRGGGTDRWLLSYADFVTLLLAFFVTMYGISTVDSKKLNPAISSLRVAFEGEAPPEGPVPVREAGSIVPQTPVRRPLDDVQAELTTQLDDAIKAGRLELLRDPRGLVVSLPESATFAVGSTEVTDGARQLIARVASVVRERRIDLTIEGHTDDVPIHTRVFRSNWELSSARASAVIAFLVEALGFDPTRLSAAGYAEFHPRVPNDTAENRARNRRVDIVIVEERP